MLNVVMLSVIILSVIMLSVVMLSVVMLSVIMVSVIMLSVVMLSVVMLSVVAPLSDFIYNSRYKHSCNVAFITVISNIITSNVTHIKCYKYSHYK